MEAVEGRDRCVRIISSGRERGWGIMLAYKLLEMTMVDKQAVHYAAGVIPVLVFLRYIEDSGRVLKGKAAHLAGRSGSGPSER